MAMDTVRPGYNFNLVFPAINKSVSVEVDAESTELLDIYALTKEDLDLFQEGEPFYSLDASVRRKNHALSFKSPKGQRWYLLFVNRYDKISVVHHEVYW